jgi:hypothetical protein
MDVNILGVCCTGSVAIVTPKFSEQTLVSFEHPISLKFNLSKLTLVLLFTHQFEYRYAAVL